MTGGSGSARDTILRAAYRSFLDVGYEKTTHRRIAEQAGHERPLVQYYIPRKADLAARFLMDVLAVGSEVVVDEQLADPHEPFTYRYVLAQVYYCALSTPPLSTFALEALDRRSIVAQVLDSDIEWNLGLIRPEDVRRQAVVDDSVMAIGGAYELFTHRLRAGQDIDPADLAARTLFAAIRSEPAARSTTEASIQAHTLAPSVLQAAAKNVISALRENPNLGTN